MESIALNNKDTVACHTPKDNTTDKLLLPCYSRWCTDVKCGTYQIKQQESRVQATQMRVLQRMGGVSRVDRGEECGHKVEAGPGRYSRCSKEKTRQVEEKTGRNE